MRNRPKIEVKCDGCGQPFYRNRYEASLTARMMRTQYCSRKCAGKFAATSRHGTGPKFSYYVEVARKRATKKGWLCDLDADSLAQMWEQQEGKCAVTGVPMLVNTRRSSFADKDIHYASIDRIDNKQGYVKGNVQFVCLGINYMRNTFSIDQLKDFINEILLVR